MPILAWATYVVKVSHRASYRLQFATDNAERALWENMGLYLVQTFHPAQTVQVGNIQLRRLQPRWHYACLVRRTHTRRAEATTYGIAHATKASSYLRHISVQYVKAANIQQV